MINLLRLIAKFLAMSQILNFLATRILPLFIVLGFFAAAIALIFSFWPFFVGFGVFSAIVYSYFQWRPGQSENRKNRLTAEDEIAQRLACEAFAEESAAKRKVLIDKMNATKAKVLAMEAKYEAQKQVEKESRGD